MPACRQLALDMLSCDPPSVRRYKQMIDLGYAGTFADGMALEQKISRDHLADVTSEAIAARRAGIQDRGRKQQQ
jgi:enoyl-CoA hydratase